MKKTIKPLVLFNASVIISALYSSKGGSAKLLQWVKERKIIGIISELIFNEVRKHVVSPLVEKVFMIALSPSEETIDIYKKIVIDQGDGHVLASAKELGVNYLVTLDKKHLLSIKNTVKDFKIVSPCYIVAQQSEYLPGRED